MAENKKSAIIYADVIHTINQLKELDNGKEKIGELFITIIEYINDYNPTPEDPIVKIAFEPIKQQFKRDLRRWDETVDGKKIKAAMGNLKRWNKDLYDLVTVNKMTLQEALFIAEERKTTVKHPVIKNNGTLKKTRTVKKNDGSDDFIAVNDNDTVNDNENDIQLPPVEIVFKPNLIDSYFTDLPNSSHIERIAADLKTTKAKLLTLIPDFRGKTELSYPNFDKFCYHFKSHARIELAKPQENKPQMRNYGS